MWCVSTRARVSCFSRSRAAELLRYALPMEELMILTEARPHEELLELEIITIFDPSMGNAMILGLRIGSPTFFFFFSSSFLISSGVSPTTSKPTCPCCSLGAIASKVCVSPVGGQGSPGSLLPSAAGFARRHEIRDEWRGLCLCGCGGGGGLRTLSWNVCQRLPSQAGVRGV